MNSNKLEDKILTNNHLNLIDSSRYLNLKIYKQEDVEFFSSQSFIRVMKYKTKPWVGFYTIKDLKHYIKPFYKLDLPFKNCYIKVIHVRYYDK